MVSVTQRPLHAFESVRDLPLAELELYAGIIAVSPSAPCAPFSVVQWTQSSRSLLPVHALIAVDELF